MTKTLILLFHPDMSNSRANAAMIDAARTLPGIEVADLHALYPDGAIDADAEVARLLSADRIVLQFPLQWYSTPPLLKAWQDLILTRMFYIDYENEGRRLQGRPIMAAVTAGNVPEAYVDGGANLYPLPELLKPLQTTAHRCGLSWVDPFLVFRANKLEAAELELVGQTYAERLADWMAPPARSTPTAPARKVKRALPVALPLSVLAMPALIWVQWQLSRTSLDLDPGSWNWATGAAVLLALPLVWTFYEATRIARRGTDRFLSMA